MKPQAPQPELQLDVEIKNLNYLQADAEFKRLCKTKVNVFLVKDSKGIYTAFTGNKRGIVAHKLEIVYSKEN